MLPILLALATALAYGIADFLTGLASRRAPMLLVMLLSQGTTTLLTLSEGFAMGGLPTTADYLWGAWAGVALLIGLFLVLVAFRDGRMSEVAPVMGVTSVTVPVLVSFLRGSRFHPLVYLGMAFAMLAIALINRRGVAAQGQEKTRRPALMAAVGAGICFGIYNSFLSMGAAENNFWLVVVSAIVRFTLLALWILAAIWKSGTVVVTGNAGRGLAIGAGVAIAAATLFFVAALQRAGDLAIINTVASQASIVTVLCACIGLREKIFPRQAIGIVASVAAIALIAYYA